MSEDTYRAVRVKDWEKHFGGNSSRDGYKMVYRHTSGIPWVKIPTTCGNRVRRLLLRENGAKLYGAFVLILLQSARTPIFGLLTDSKGLPLDSVDMAGAFPIEPGTYDECIRICTTDSRVDFLEWHEYTLPWFRSEVEHRLVLASEIASGGKKRPNSGKPGHKPKWSMRAGLNAICEIWNTEIVTKAEQTRYEKVVRAILQKIGDCEDGDHVRNEISRRYNDLRSSWSEHIHVTPEAVLKHWDSSTSDAVPVAPALKEGAY